jgi:hypothetical protein
MPSTREVLDVTIGLERKTMALYARFARNFSGNPLLHEFWFGMARDEARHLGALALVSTVLELSGKLDVPSPIPLEDLTITRMRELLAEYEEETESGVEIERALEIAVTVEETELEDLVGHLLQALQAPDEYERCLRLLVHDLGELSYMIEQYCQDQELLRRCDVLVDRHAETLRRSAAD